MSRYHPCNTKPNLYLRPGILIVPSYGFFSSEHGTIARKNAVEAWQKKSQQYHILCLHIVGSQIILGSPRRRGQTKFDDQSLPFLFGEHQTITRSLYAAQVAKFITRHRFCIPYCGPGTNMGASQIVFDVQNFILFQGPSANIPNLLNLGEGGI